MRAERYTGIKPYAIVLGLDSPTGLQSARILAQHHIPVIAIARDPAHYNCRTRVCEQILYADTSTDELLHVLETLAHQFDQKPVLVTCEDLNVKNVSRHRDTLKEHYAFVLPDPGEVELAFDKLSFYEYAEKHGFRVPHTFVIDDRQELERAAGLVTYPCILKPTGRTTRWDDHTPLKVFKAARAEELLEIYDRYHVWADRLLVQEWVVGPDGNVFSCYCYYDQNSQPIVAYVARKIRQWPPETGMSCSAEECRNDEVLQQSLRLFTGLQHKGFGHLEMKRDDRTGEHVMIEAHVGRPTGKSLIVEAGGVEFVYSMYCDALGWALPENVIQQYRGAKWINLRQDLQSAFHYWRKGELDVREWIGFMLSKKAQAVFSWSDPGPFIGDLQRGVHLHLHPEDRIES